MTGKKNIDIERRVKKAAQETQKREVQQDREFKRYLNEANKAPLFSDEKIVELWDKLGEKIKKGDKKEIKRTEKEVFKANLKQLVLIAESYKSESYIKPYFTFFEIIKLAENTLWMLIHHYNWSHMSFNYKSSIAAIAMKKNIVETSMRLRYKIVTGENYEDPRGLIAIKDIVGAMFDDVGLTYAEKSALKVK